MSIKSISYAIIGAKDPAGWRSFGTEVLGMMEGQSSDAGTVLLRCDERPFRFMVVAHETDALLATGFEVGSEQHFAELCDALTAAGVSVEEGNAAEASERRVRGLVKLRDPAGNAIELCHGAALDYAKFVSPQGIDGFETGFNGDMGFGHAVLPAPALDETYRFYTGLLGFDDSDYMHFQFSDDPADGGMGLHFLHAENPRHHSLALFQGESEANCIHLMLEVRSVDEVGYCLDRALARDIPITSTLGRHSNDRMLSFYMMTPGGFPLEFGCEGLQIDWADFAPTVTELPSIWGHKWGG
ncbi:MAG: VOC family protein [Halieaceae bacterium]|jgi:3,4-dihydroxy-9,10-secoandrosta-1,3,5(10)-triene-9,17-dione 4,5-dioxygenase|nr:VOC family protein [Halieaceae bacterium]